jgi:hypothetical protein
LLFFSIASVYPVPSGLKRSQMVFLRFRFGN